MATFNTLGYPELIKAGRQLWSSKRPALEDRMPSLLFLMRLQHVQFPFRVTDPGELRHVSVLLATGLIKATIETLAPAQYNIPLGRATVLGITAEGLREIAAMGALPQFVGASMGFSRRVHVI